MFDSGVTFAGAWVPQGTYIAQNVAVARVHIWAPGQVLGIRAQLQGTGLCSPLTPSLPVAWWGGQKHTSDQRDAGTFPLGWQDCIYQQNGKPGFTPNVSKRDSKSYINVRSACTACGCIRSAAVDFLDRLKCCGRSAKRIGYRLRVSWGSYQLTLLREG